MSSPPDAASLREAALSYLARHEATVAGVLRVLERRIGRWARTAAAAGMFAEDVERGAALAREAAREVVAALARAGGVDDGRYAASRARLHARQGRSSRASAARLAQAGIAAPLAQEAATRDREGELDAAVAHARRRRLGPFAPPTDEPPDPARRHKAFSSFARAGFSADIARQVLALDAEAAEERLARLRES